MNFIASKCMKQNLTELQGTSDKTIIIVGNWDEFSLIDELSRKNVGIEKYMIQLILIEWIYKKTLKFN